MNVIRPGLAAASKMTKQMAEKAAKRPFYSAVDKAIAEITEKQPKGTGDQYLAMIMKTKGVKPAEIKDRGIDVALKGKGKTSGEELQKIADERPPTQLQERRLKEEVDDPEETGVFYGSEEYGSYRTPGGENYREILIRLPQEKKQSKVFTADELKENGYRVEGLEYNPYTHQSSYKIIDPEGNVFIQASGKSGVSNEYQALNRTATELSKSAETESKKPIFRSSHFGKEGENLLAHARAQDMTGPNGEKILVIDEIQSDLHQQGRKAGYNTNEAGQQYSNLQKEFEDYRNELKPRARKLMEDHNFPIESIDNYLKSSDYHLANLLGENQKFQDYQNEIFHLDPSRLAPDAPFKKNWHELVMKRLVDDAAKNGYDKVIMAPGSEQALRYEKPELLNGMQGFYDQILPSYIKNQYGIEVGQYPVKVRDLEVVRENRGEGFAVVRPGGGTVAKYPTIEEAQAAAAQMNEVPYHSFDITPEMRESITTQGQPLYQIAPVAGAVGAGMMATSEEPEQYKKGGVVRKPVSMDAMRLAALNKDRKRKYG